MARILVVDDDDQFRRMVQRTLERAGYEVEPAANGKEALARFEARPPDLVLTDLVMPEKEGLETILALRQKWKTPRIIAMSGGGRNLPEEYLEAARVLGVAATLEKPFATKDLLTAVRSVLERPSSP
ncbi:MAG: response regulator [Gemmatimonadales bacterium]